MRKKLILCLVATMCMIALGSTVSAQSDAMDWQKYAGATVRFIGIEGPWYNAVENEIAAFEEATGITVTVEILPETQAYEKIRVELQAGNENLDVFYNQPTRFGVEFTTNGWYEPLDSYLANSSLTSADFDYPGDFPSPSVDAVTFDGETIAIPTDRDLGRLLFYRKDLLEQFDLAVPTTFDELEEAARVIYEGTNGEVAGIANRGKGASATSQFASTLNEFGGRWQDADGNITVNSPEAVAAFDWWGRTLREYGPAGSATFDYPEVTNEFLTGRAAFSLEGAINTGNVNDPATSQVVGKVGYTVIPEGPGGPSVRENTPCQVSRMFGLSISSQSGHKEPAWYFVQWMAGKQAQLDYLLAGRLAARVSAWQSPEFGDYKAAEPEYWNAMETATQICYATPQFAPASIVDQARARDIIGQVIVASILGDDVQAAADGAQQELEALKARQ